MMVHRTLLLLAALGFVLQSGCASHFCSSGACGSVTGGHLHGDVVSDCGACGGKGCGTCLAGAKDKIHKGLTCGSGCGELVWDEWIDNPPDCCDPCNDCGQWTGIRGCAPSLLSYCNLWGVRTGCSTCGDAPYIDSTPLQKGASQKGASQKGTVHYGIEQKHGAQKSVLHQKPKLHPKQRSQQSVLQPQDAKPAADAATTGDVTQLESPSPAVTSRPRRVLLFE